MEAGTPYTLAAGNAGADGPFDGSSAANGFGVIAVGSVDNTQLPEFDTLGTDSTNGASASQFLFTPASIGLPNITLPLYAVSYDTSVPADGCTPFPTDTPDLSDYVALVRREGCTFDVKAQNAASSGAKYVMYYNNVAGLLSPSVTAGTMSGAAMTTANQGAEWITLLKAGDKVVIDLTNLTTIFVINPNNMTGGFMSTFTEWNPTNELYQKPEVSAPGGNILSAFPRSNGSYGILSGTSMATPYIAGVIALMKQANPDLSVAEIRTLLATTASPVNFNDGKTTYDYLAPTIQQGGGDVNASAAVHTSAVLSVPNLAFNDSTHFVPEANFSLTNRGSSFVTYSFSY